MNNRLDFDLLCELSNKNFENFSKTRNLLISDFLENPLGNTKELRALQDEIDLIRTSQCSPHRTIDGITALISTRILALQQLTEELLSLSKKDHQH